LQMLLSILRLVLQRIDPPIWTERFSGPLPININMCLAVSDECKFLRKKCGVCVPLLVETLDEVLLLPHWPRDLTVLITTFL